MLTPSELDAIRARADTATKGPWVYREDSNEIYSGEVTVIDSVPFEGGGIGDDDGVFVAAARTDIPDLLSHIAEQERVIDQLREALVKENELIKAGVLGALLGLPCVLSKNEIEAKINEAVDQAQAALDAAGRKGVNSL